MWGIHRRKFQQLPSYFYRRVETGGVLLRQRPRLLESALKDRDTSEQQCGIYRRALLPVSILLHRSPCALIRLASPKSMLDPNASINLTLSLQTPWTIDRS